MATARTKRGIATLFTLFLASYWLTQQQEEEPAGPIAGLDLELNYALSNFEIQMYDEEGLPSINMKSPRLGNDADTGIAQVEDPVLELHHQGFIWNIIADAATVSDDQEVIFLSGNVHMERQGATPVEWLEVDSSDVTVEVTPRVAHSIRDIAMRDATGAMSATGFRVDMAKNEFELNNEVKGVYDIQE